jgi:GTPase SAR1 family protein
MDQAIVLRSKCQNFRILIIGEANAGKTTILKKVCNSIDDPEIFSPAGKRVTQARALLLNGVDDGFLQLDVSIDEGFPEVGHSTPLYFVSAQYNTARTS